MAAEHVADRVVSVFVVAAAVAGAGFIMRDMTVENRAGAARHQAVALLVSGDHAVVYRSAVLGYQDTLYAHAQRQFYRDCDVAGTVDFVFGNAAVVLQNCTLWARRPLPGQENTVTAQGRRDPNQSTGISVHGCRLLPSPELELAPAARRGRAARPLRYAMALPTATVASLPELRALVREVVGECRVQVRSVAALRDAQMYLALSALSVDYQWQVEDGDLERLAGELLGLHDRLLRGHVHRAAAGEERTRTGAAEAVGAVGVAKGKGDYCVSGSGSRWTRCTAAVYGNERPGSTLSKTDGRDLIGLPRLTGNDDDDVGDDITTGGGSGAHARRRTTARRRKRRASTRSGRRGDPYRGTNGGGRRPDDDGDEEEAAATVGLTTTAVFRRSSATTEGWTRTATAW